MNRSEIEKIKRTEEIVAQVDNPKTVTLVVLDLQDIYELMHHEDKRVTAVPMYRICFSKLLNSKEIIRVIDNRLIVATGVHEISMSEVDAKEVKKLYGRERWINWEGKDTMSDTVYKIVEIYDTSDTLQFLHTNKVSFKELYFSITLNLC